MRGEGVVERVERRVRRLRVSGWLGGVTEVGVRMRRGRWWGGWGRGRGRARSWVWTGVSDGGGG